MNKLPNNNRVISESRTIAPALVATMLVACLLGLLAMYMYFLSMSVVHVVLRKEVHQTMQVVRTDIAELEASYIEAQHAVSERIASAQVLTETNEKIFIERSAPTLVLGTTIE